MDNLNKLIYDVKRFIIRSVKELSHYRKTYNCIYFTHENYIYAKLIQSSISYINNINYIDKVLEDILDIILQQGLFKNEFEFIEDINEYIKNSRIMSSTDFLTNKKDIIKYMKSKGELYCYMSCPIMNLFCWSSTKKGGEFYSILSKNIDLLLHNYFDIKSYCMDAINKFMIK